MPRTNAKALTDKSVMAAKAPVGKRLELWDARSPGLCLRVSESGAKSWVVRYRTLDGRQPRFSLGAAGNLKGALSLVEARDRASEVRRMAREGGDPANTKRATIVEAKTMTLRLIDDLADEYFERCAAGTYRATRTGKKAATIAAERSLYAYRIKPHLGKTPIDGVTKAEVKRLLEDIADEAPIQSNRARALLRAMFNFAIHEERVGKNPVAGIMAVAKEEPRDRILSDGELRALWSALSNPSGFVVEEAGSTKPLWISPAVLIALRLSVLTLQRRTEVAGMRRDELRLDEGVWIIGKDRTKNGKAHLVPLSAPALALVRQALSLSTEPSDFVFPSPWKKLQGQPIDGGALSHALSDVYSAIGIRGANLHDLRRTGASAMASERLLVPPIVISRVLNHTMDGGGGAMVTARHYAVHDYAKEKRSALEAWASLLQTIVADAA